MSESVKDHGASITQGISDCNIANGKINNEPLDEDTKMEFESKQTEFKQVIVKEESEMKEEPVQDKDVEIKITKENEINVELIQDFFKFDSSSSMEDDKSSSMEDDESKDSSESEIEEDEIEDHYVRSESESDERTEYPYVKAIKNILGVVKRPSTFACGGVLEEAALQLSVKDVGKIKLPLSYKQGEVLKSKCTAAPFGRGSETLVQTSVRDAWQVDAKDVTLDKDFQKVVKEKLPDIITSLMGEDFTENQQIKCNLYKLVYYEQGGHFVAHRDTEKSPGMFATLVIQLPADHKGGALVVRHKEETKVFDFEDDSIHNFFFTAFFADCEHELRKVTAGHRLVLIYNLIRKNSHSTSQPNNDIITYNNHKFITTMKTSVEEWKSDNKGPQYLALKLDHLYTESNISFQNLKGKDKTIADALCSCPDIQVYLAIVTKEENRLGYNDNNYGHGPDLAPESDYSECYYELHNWMDVNNMRRPFGKRSLDTKKMLNEDDFLVQKCEERCGSEYSYTGNEGCNIKFFYKTTALVFWPNSHEILISCSANFSSELVNCKRLSVSKMEGALEKLKGILFYIEKRHSTAMSQLQNKDNVATIFEIMSLFEIDTIKCLANSFLLALSKPHGSKYYRHPKEKIIGLPNKNCAVKLAYLIYELSWESLGKNVLQLVKESAVSHSESCTQLVRSLVLLGLHEQVVNIVKVATSVIVVQSDDLSSKDWIIWAVLLASYTIFSTCFDDIIKQISKLKDDILIEIIVQMHRSLQTKVIDRYRLKKCFQTFFSILKDNGWKNLSLKSITLLWPVLFFVFQFNEDVSILHSFVQAVIEHKNSSDFLKELLKLPNMVEAKDNPSVQLMVQKRLQQLDIPYPAFSWAQPNAKLEKGYITFGTLNLEEVNNFLRSDKETKIFRNVFSGKREAKAFGEKYFQFEYRESMKYSARFELSGSGKKVEIKVIKTKNYYDAEVRKCNLMHEEAESLVNTFCEPKDTVSCKRARNSNMI